VIGDIHTRATALERLLEFFAQLSLDALLCCGDVLDGPGDALRCVELLSHREDRMDKETSLHALSQVRPPANRGKHRYKIRENDEPWRRFGETCMPKEFLEAILNTSDR
jgi:Icc-related predicted phosphoesterase